MVSLGNHLAHRRCTDGLLLMFSWDATVTGTLFVYTMLHGGYPISYAITYSGLSLLLNLTVTAIIAGRLLLHRRRMIRHFGQGYGSYYASVAAVLIESASLYTVYLILVIIFFTIGTPTSNVLQQAVAQVEVNCPY